LLVHPCEEDRLVECHRTLEGDVRAKRFAQIHLEELDLLLLGDAWISTVNCHKLVAAVLDRAIAAEESDLAKRTETWYRHR
jgi:hypothetical protein